jgi:tetratricopeptide (TPR) repeat protein
MRLVLVLLAALLLAPVPARAQREDASSARELIKQAERLYDQKNYLEAAEALEKAHAALPDPRLLYNIARAYDQGGKTREAIQYYEQYKARGTDLQLLKRADLLLDRLKRQQQKKAEAEAEAERQRLRDEAEAARRLAEEERESARRAEESHQQRLAAANEATRTARRHMQMTSFTLGGVALASAGMGTFFGLKSREARARFDAATTLSEKSKAKTATVNNAVLADIGFGVGLAYAVAALLLYPKEPLPRQGEARLTLAPRGLGAGMEVGF